MSKLNELQKERLAESLKNKTEAIKQNKVILKNKEKGKRHASTNS